MARGGWDPFPIRLGGSAVEGWRAEGHARLCADLSSAKRTSPFAVIRVSVDHSLSKVSLAHCQTQAKNTVSPPSLTYTPGTPGWIVVIRFPSTSAEEGERGETSFVCTSARVGTNSAAAAIGLSCLVSGDTVTVSHDSDASFDFTLVVHGTVSSKNTSISAYGGSLNKRNNSTEHPVPYAAQIYRDLQRQRGSAYSTKPGTIVAAENFAIARQIAATGYRLPEKLTNNLLGPAHADEGVPYWSRVLGLPTRSSESDYEWRARGSIHFRPASAPNYDKIRRDCAELLGEAFVGLTIEHDGELQDPPKTTYWPGVNAGSSAYDLGGGTWQSNRSHFTIEAKRPGGISTGEYNSLMNEDLFQMIDRMLPVWCTASWIESGTALAVWGGFYWDSGVKWGATWDWKS